MYSSIKSVFAVLLIIGVGLVTGCSIDSSSDVTDQVDDLIEQDQAQAEAAAAEQSSSSGSSDSSSSSHSASPSSSSGGGSSGGFVWKPVSEGDGNLVVLLPSAYAGSVVAMDIVKGGSVVERGRFTGNTNGNRPTFRFRQPGAGYGSGLTVVARLSDGSNKTWPISAWWQPRRLASA